MLLVSFGSPSAIGYAVTDIMRAALEGTVGTHTVFHVISLEDFKAKWQATTEAERAAVLITSDCPHGDVVKLCLAARGPIVVSCDSFEHIVAYLIRSRGMGFAPAIRLATQVVCALETLTREPNVLRVSIDDHGRDVRELAAALVTFTGLQCSDARFDAILDGLQADGGGRARSFRDFIESRYPHFSDDETDDLAAGERAILSIMAQDYDALIEGRAADAVRWPTGLLLDADRQGQLLDGPCDLLGPARFLLYGPYLHLPVGRWRLSVEMEVEDCLSDNRLGADICSGRVLVAATMTLPARGRRGFDLDFAVTDPFLPVELRVELLTGAIEGRIRIRDVRLSRAADGGRDTPPVPSLAAPEADRATGARRRARA